MLNLRIFEDENGQIVEIIEFQHHRKSQARAVVRVKLRNIHTGSLIETAYRPEDKFKEVEVEKRPFNYLYDEGDMAVFMNSENYEQVSVPIEKLKDQKKYLKDNMETIGIYINGQLLNMELPIKVPLTIASTVPGVKGDTVANMTKMAYAASAVAKAAGAGKRWKQERAARESIPMRFMSRKV